MKRIYLLMAIIGSIVPYYFFFQFFGAEGLNLPLFVKALFPNGAAGGFSADLLITSVVFWIYMYQQKNKADGPNPVIFIALNLFVGLSSALPAYLYAREE